MQDNGFVSNRNSTAGLRVDKAGMFCYAKPCGNAMGKISQARFYPPHYHTHSLLTHTALKWTNPNDTLKQVIKKVRRRKEHILTFIKHEGAPNHNNYGEYIKKKGVVKRKMSSGNMSAEGAKAYACIQSVAMTCQLRGISFHRFLKASLMCYIRTGRAMLLAELRVQYETGGNRRLNPV